MLRRIFKRPVRMKKTICVYRGYGMHEEDTAIVHRALTEHVSPSEYQVIHVTPKEILEDKLKDGVTLLAIGGGFDLGLIKVLGQPGMTKIREFVHNGGSYLGICSGAYFACDYIEFDKGGPLQVVGERFLKFYPGSCIGPLYKTYDYKSKSGSVASLIDYTEAAASDEWQGKQNIACDDCLVTESNKTKNNHHSAILTKKINKSIIDNSTRLHSEQSLNSTNGEKNAESICVKCIEHRSVETAERAHCGEKKLFRVYFNGGGKFINKDMNSLLKCASENVVETQTNNGDNCPSKKRKLNNDGKNSKFDNVSILSHYTDLPSHPAAVVKCKFGKGVAVLSGAHFEYDADDLDGENEYVKDIIPDLRMSSHDRRILFKSVLQHLNISVNKEKSSKL